MPTATLPAGPGRCAPARQPASRPIGPNPSAPLRLGQEPALDGLRALAVLCVMFAHTSLLGAGADLSGLNGTSFGLAGGFLGVDIFFVLSGFLITALLLKEHGQTGRISLRAFYGRRVLRLLPAMVVLLGAVGLCAAWRLGGGDFRPVRRGIPLALACSVNTYFVVRGGHAGLLTHFWSLGVEEKFYFLWPVVLCALLRWRLRRRWVVLGVAAGVVASALLRAACWGNDGAFGPRLAISGLPARSDNLLVGVLLALLACWRGLPRSAAWRAAWRVGAWGALALLAGLVWYCGPGPGVYSLAGAATALLVAGLVAGPPRLLRAALGAPPLAWVGRISYGLYLWHVPVFSLAPLALFRPVGPSGPAFLSAAALGFALSFGAAAASHYLVERPFLRWKARLARA
jgi:peptidoglycan/LPS O-acetylase OafA/YrhL